MNLDLARAALAQAALPNHLQPSFRGARDVLIEFGCAALEIPRRSGLSVHDLVKLAEEAPPSDARRAFAVLLVDALGIPGLLTDRGEAERHTRWFLERALLNPLRRSGYDLGGTAYDKRQALARLHETIDEHLRPLEPSIPRWIHGVGEC
jgi:hypothetical protein